ncbi:MAG TPA: hypothetical protein VGJ20_10400 [Xanthobacteraceae bacterium]
MLTRNEFCALTGLSYANLDNRTRAGQLALAFGLTKPAVMGEYHPMDVFANALADALVERGFPRETAVHILLKYHETWLLGLTRAEWELGMVSYNARGERIAERQIYFTVARTGRGKAEMFRTAAGLPDEALEDLRQGGPATDMVFVNVHDALHAVRDAFYENDLLEEFVVGPGANMPIFTRHPKSKAEFDAWREEIRQYREQSIDRLKTRERARQERRKKQPARKRQLVMI